MLTLRPTGLSPPIYRDQFDYEVLEDGHPIGRMYEDLHALPELRWFWSITVFVGYPPGVTGPDTYRSQGPFCGELGQARNSSP